MPRKLNSFLIRWWRGSDTERLELEHIQSGRKHLSGSIEEAVAWLETQQEPDQELTDGEHTAGHQPRGGG